MTDPNNIVALDDVRRVLKGVMIEPAAVSEEDFKRFISTTYAAAAKAESAAQARRRATAGAAVRGAPSGASRRRTWRRRWICCSRR